MQSNPIFNWDEAKRKSNITKHGLDFIEIGELQWDDALYSLQIVDYEERVVAFVPFGLNVRVVVFTEREEFIRVISYRNATRQ